MTPNGKQRLLFSWEFDDRTAFQIYTTAGTEETLSMLEQLIAIKRAEMSKNAEGAPPPVAGSPVATIRARAEAHSDALKGGARAANVAAEGPASKANTVVD